MRIQRTRFLAFLLAGMLLLSGCSGQVSQATVPELIEPVAANAAYRPVELGVIGETKVLYGTVMPVEYCCFYDTGVKIEEIVVDIGDYVEAGDVVAYVDIDMAKETLESLNLQLENLQQNYELNAEIAQWEIAQIVYRQITWEDVFGEEMPEEEEPENDVSGNYISGNDISGNDVSGNTVSGNNVSGNDAPKDDELEKKKKEFAKAAAEFQAQKETDIAVALENLSYDEMLHGYRVEQLQESIDNMESIIAEGTLRASHSGYVVYVKNMSKSTYASAYENVVVLTDPEKTYIELTDRTINKYTYEDYEVKYMQLAGETYDVTELSYGVEAEILAKVSGRYPNVQLICPEAPNLVVGEMYPIFYREQKMEEVPIIGLDSLEGEEDAYYVYVRTEDGEREKRFVTIGDSDNYYVQILDGLKEGELVYYESEARMPAEYVEYVVELSDHNIDNLSRLYQLADEQVIWYEAECAGTITEFAVEKNDEVKTGDLLYVMRSDAGKAALAAALNDINRENTTYEETIKQLDKNLSVETDPTAKEILVRQKELETINHAYRLNQLEKTYNDMLENNNGNGEIRVYAKHSGTITGIKVGEDAEVFEGDYVLAIGNEAEDLLFVEMTEMKDVRNYPYNIAEVGEKITFVAGNNAYEGVCVGWTAHKDINLNKYYVSETDDGPKISFCTKSGYQLPAFYVELEDDKLYQNLPMGGEMVFSYVSMEDVVVVPTALVYEETNAKNPTRTDYFVWRVVGDELVKQYVLINKEYSDINNTLILSGVEENDVLAREK